jgi:hypothetical protein
MKGIGNRQKRFVAAKRVWVKSPPSPKSKNRPKPAGKRGRPGGDYVISDIKKP